LRLIHSAAEESVTMIIAAIATSGKTLRLFSIARFGGMVNG
jgi:hypothetical protein